MTAIIAASAFGVCLFVGVGYCVLKKKQKNDKQKALLSVCMFCVYFSVCSVQGY